MSEAEVSEAEVSEANGSIRIAVAGKGGAGKTTLSATLARLAARSGRRVLVIDGDSNPNVAVALGCDRPAAASIQPLPTSLVSRRLNGTALVEPVTTVMERYATLAPDDVAVMLMAMPAHADEGCLCSAHATVSAMLADVATQSDFVSVLDLEASPEHLSRGTTRHVDALLLVTEPYYRSLETTRRMAALASELPIPYLGVVANKVRSSDDTAAIHEFCQRHGLPQTGQVPWSDAVAMADKLGVPVIDGDPDGPIVAAVTAVADTLVALPSRESAA